MLRSRRGEAVLTMPGCHLVIYKDMDVTSLEWSGLQSMGLASQVLRKKLGKKVFKGVWKLVSWDKTLGPKYYFKHLFAFLFLDLFLCV